MSEEERPPLPEPRDFLPADYKYRSKMHLQKSRLPHEVQFVLYLFLGFTIVVGVIVALSGVYGG
jgi:hypothetical protein